MFPCGSLHLFKSVTGRRLSEINWGCHQSDQLSLKVQATYLLMLEVLAKVILVDLGEFPFH